MLELANSPRCQQLNGQHLAGFPTEHAHSRLPMQSPWRQNATSANAFRPNEPMREHGTAGPDGIQRTDWISARKTQNTKGLKASGAFTGPDRNPSPQGT